MVTNPLAGLLPTSPAEGPPLPRVLGICWPWYDSFVAHYIRPIEAATSLDEVEMRYHEAGQAYMTGEISSAEWETVYDAYWRKSYALL